MVNLLQAARGDLKKACAHGIVHDIVSRWIQADQPATRVTAPHLHTSECATSECATSGSPSLQRGTPAAPRTPRMLLCALATGVTSSIPGAIFQLCPGGCAICYRGWTTQLWGSVLSSGKGGCGGASPPPLRVPITHHCASPHHLMQALVAHNVISSGFGGFPHAAYSCQHHCIPNHQPLKLSTTAPILQPATHVLRCAWKWDVDANNSRACALSIYISAIVSNKRTSTGSRGPPPLPRVPMPRGSCAKFRPRSIQ